MFQKNCTKIVIKFQTVINRKIVLKFQINFKKYWKNFELRKMYNKFEKNSVELWKSF